MFCYCCGINSTKLIIRVDDQMQKNVYFRIDKQK